MTHKPSGLDGEDAEDLTQRVRRGLLFSILNTGIGRAGTFLSGLVLARLMDPEDFGLFAIATVALTALLSINDLGVSVALIKWETDPRRIAPTVMTLAFLGSVLLFAICFLAAPALADALQAPEATWLIRFLALGVLADAVTSVPAALMTREFMQGRRTALDLASFLVSTAVTIVLAAAGAGAWSLVVGRLVASVWNTVTFLAYSPVRVRPGWDRAVVMPLLRFGLPLAGASLLVFAMGSVDSVVVGATLGPVVLGYYTMAMNLAMWPVNILSTTMRRVTIAAFSRVTTAEMRSRAVARSLPPLVLVLAPLSLGMAMLSAPMIAVLYGEKWLPSAPILTGLAFVAAGRVLLDYAYDFLVAAGQGSRALVLQAIWLAVLTPALIVAARMSQEAYIVAACSAAVSWLVAIPMYAISVRRAGVSFSQCSRPLRQPLLSSIALVVVVGALQMLDLADVPNLVVSVAIGGVVYLSISRGMVLQTYRELRGG